MITAEIDRLANADRRVLRYASVLGMSFDATLVGGAAGRGRDRERARTRGSGWRSSSTTRAAGRYRFRHALMRDAAYEGLPYRRRRELHARVGSAVLASAGDADHEHAELLSLHFFLAGDFDRAWRYSMIAAERAEAAYANMEALASSAARSMPAVTSRLDERELEAAHEALADAGGTPVTSRAVEANAAAGNSRKVNPSSSQTHLPPIVHGAGRGQIHRRWLGDEGANTPRG